MASLVAYFLLFLAYSILIAAYPSIEVVDGNLNFITDASGSRIGYKYQNKSIVYFDQLQQTDQNFGLQLEMMYNLGITDGNLKASVDMQGALLNLSMQFNAALQLQASTTAANLNASLSVLTNALNTEISARIALASTLSVETSRAVVVEADHATTINALTSNLATVTANLATVTANLATVTSNLNAEIAARIASVAFEAARGLAAENQLTLNMAVLQSSTTQQYLTLGSGLALMNSSLSNQGLTVSGEYWTETAVTLNDTLFSTAVTANTAGNTIRLNGFGFDVYFSPAIRASFVCSFYNSILGNFSSYGRVLMDFYVTKLFSYVLCPIPPAALVQALNLTVSLLKIMGQVYPFAGFVGSNNVAVLYTTTNVTVIGVNVVVLGIGFNGALPYRCRFSGKNSTGALVNVTNSALNATSTSINCGQVPFGFKITAGVCSANVSILEVNSDLSDGYAVQSSISGFTYLSCFDNYKDGVETDVDCGGSFCFARCPLASSCDTIADCISVPGVSCYLGKCIDSYFWNGIALTPASRVALSSCAGLNVALTYRCIFTSTTNPTLNATFNVLPTSSSLLDCGPSPTAPGFNGPLFSTTNVSFTVAVYEVNSTNNKTGFQLSAFGANKFTYIPCSNGVKDGNETDVDCGGNVCGNRCATGYKCLLESDCGITDQCSTGVCSIKFLFPVEYLVIAGGGGSGAAENTNGYGGGAGGGGAGGYRSSVVGQLSGGGAAAEPTLTLPPGSYNVVVGNGGIGGVGSGTRGTTGGNSVFYNVISSGGGAGGGDETNVGLPGGSGGGIGGDFCCGTTAGTANQGFGSGSGSSGTRIGAGRG